MKLEARSPGASGLRFVAVVVVVFLAHLLFLIRGVKPPSLGSTKGDQQRLSVSLLQEELTVIAQPVAQRPVVEQPVRLDQTASPPDKTAAPLPRSVPNTSTGAMQASSPGLEQKDGRISIDFQLARSEGPVVEIGTMNLSFQLQSGKYEARALWSAGSDRGEYVSQGTSGTVLHPSYFSDSVSLMSGQALSGQVQDQLSVIWNFRNLVSQVMSQTPPRYEQTWDMTVQLGGQSRLMHWSVEPMDYLILPAGRFRAARVVGVVENDLTTRFSIWYAVDSDYLPIRIERRDENGRIQDAKITTPLARVAEVRQSRQ
jgi:hypothetical protein